jgi:hypothetical protein
MILTGKRRNRTSVEDQIKRDQREQNTHRSAENNRTLGEGPGDRARTYIGLSNSNFDSTWDWPGLVWFGSSCRQKRYVFVHRLPEPEEKSDHINIGRPSHRNRWETDGGRFDSKELEGNGTAGTTGKNPAERVGRFFKLKRNSGLNTHITSQYTRQKNGNKSITDPQPPFAPAS